MKRIVRSLTALLLIAVMALTPFASAQAASVGNFQDVSGSDWYYNAVNFVVGKGLFQGTSNTAFSPNGTMTRGMFITVLGRYAGVNASAWCAGTVTGSGVNLRSGPGTSYGAVMTLGQGTVVTILDKSGSWYKVSTGANTGYVSADYVSAKYHAFSDVGYGSYYAGYAIWAYEKGIISGNGSASVFAPDQNVTREQVCTILSRFASVLGITVSQSKSKASFPDDGKISSWAKDSVYAMQQAGIVNGDTDGSFRPTGSASRAEAATMLQRFDSACGGYTPPASSGGSSGGTSGGSATPPKPDAPTPDTPADTPVSDGSGYVSIPSSTVRVGILVKTNGLDSSVQTVTLQSSGGFAFGTMSDNRTFAASGTTTDSATVTVTTNGSTFTVKAGDKAVYTTTSNLAIHPQSSGKPVTCVNSEYRYYGDFELRQASGKSGYITVINYVNIEDYTKGVLPYEFSTGWPAETLKAAAVAVRSFAMSYDRSTYSGYGFDIPANGNAQLYRGRGITMKESEFAATDKAVDDTKGLYLTYNNKICVACYSACNGGNIRSAKEVYGVDYPYLTAKSDPYEQAAKKDVYGDYNSVVSASHRVGMSAWGAYAMDKYYGKDYKAILGFYFTGAQLQYGA